MALAAHALSPLSYRSHTRSECRDRFLPSGLNETSTIRAAAFRMLPLKRISQNRAHAILTSGRLRVLSGLFRRMAVEGWVEIFDLWETELALRAEMSRGRVGGRPPQQAQRAEFPVVIEGTRSHGGEQSNK